MSDDNKRKEELKRAAGEVGKAAGKAGFSFLKGTLRSVVAAGQGAMAVVKLAAEDVAVSQGNKEKEKFGIKPREPDPALTAENVGLVAKGTGRTLLKEGRKTGEEIAAAAKGAMAPAERVAEIVALEAVDAVQARSGKVKGAVQDKLNEVKGVVGEAAEQVKEKVVETLSGVELPELPSKQELATKAGALAAKAAPLAEGLGRLAGRLTGKKGEPKSVVVEPSSDNLPAVLPGSQVIDVTPEVVETATKPKAKRRPRAKTKAPE